MIVSVVLLLICQTVLGGVLLKPHYDLEDAEDYFQQFIEQFERNYTSKEHKQSRFEIFKRNLLEINQLNKEQTHAVFGVNKFADMTAEELLSSHTGTQAALGIDSKCKEYTDKDVTTKDAPETLDWRDQNVVTAVKDQGQCGSCWAFSVTGNVESVNAIKTKKLVSLSEQQLLDCDKQSEGCNGGYLTTGASSIVEKGGQESESDYKYEAANGTCRFDASKLAVKVTGCNAYKVSDEDKTKEVLFKNGPLSVAIDATSLIFYSGGIVDCSFNHLNHGVLLVGYGTENGVPYWLIKNSWNAKWGEKGYFRVQRGSGDCGITTDYHVSVITE